MSGQELFFVLGFFLIYGFCIHRLEQEIIGLKLRLADLDRDVTALEASTYGDGK